MSALNPALIWVEVDLVTPKQQEQNQNCKAKCYETNTPKHIPDRAVYRGSVPNSHRPRRRQCNVISGGQFRRTGIRLVPAPTDV